MQETLLNVTTDAALFSWSGARDVSQRMVTFADVNVTAALDHAERVFQARTPREAAIMHKEYLRDQARCVAQQTREIHDLAAKALGEALGAVVPTK
ncbi:phasin family protein [Methylobacterium sp. WSM2598]|uniref:phasin family protein n=1 Tax=Methylobacterium sp. WSM2598 TaxID=398261 RepID=UPI0006ACF0D3|nr:phasin family protein [Methylobacterium sp. WSM2598]